MTTPKTTQQKKWKLAIKLLNEVVKVRIQPSPIHGVGVFAIRAIKEGEIMELDAIPHQFDVPFSMMKDIRKDAREIILGQFPAIAVGSHFLYPVTRMQAFLNHSDNPNYDGQADKTLRDVAKGEELTEDYRKIPGHDKVFPWLVPETVV